MKRYAFITARSGSKGVPDKNIIDLCGKPLMAWSIEAATQSGVFDRVIVSTDSEHYADIAREWGAEVMMRGENLSNDTAPHSVVLRDMISRLPADFDYFVLLQPTSPLRNARHLQEACALFDAHADRFDFLTSVIRASHPSVLVREIDDDMSLKNFDIDYSQYRRQNYRDFTPNGAIFLGRPDAYVRQGHFYGPRCIAYEMNTIDSVDIDNQLDLEIARLIIKNKWNN
ncbi:MAG: acylneuraminate cytidylyltransferase family protein [Alloprevotella sp.]|nr:acylneuraminate cytidylyltransferase family protein [Alloprevotella sp.]